MTAATFGDEVRRLRTQATLSLRDVAAAVPCDPGYLSRIERGLRKPTLAIVQALDHKLAAGGTLVSLVAASGAGAVESDGAEEADTQRRAVVKGLAAAGLAVAGWPVAATTGWQLPRRIGPEHVGDVVDTTQLYRQWVSLHGGTTVRQPVAVLLERASAMFSAASDPTVRQSLLVAIADLAGLGAYVARDLGAATEAQQHYQLSLSAAHAAEHIGLGAHTIVRMAGHHLELRQPDQVLLLLRAVREHAGSDLAAGDIANQRTIEAWAHAQAGNTQATLRAVGQAEEAFANAGSEVRPWAAQHVTEAELHSLVGAAFVDLTRHDRRFAAEAVDRLSRALALRSPSAARNRTLDQVSLAEAYLRGDELAQAGNAGLLALDGVQGITSARLQLRLHGLKQAMTSRAGRHAAIAEFVRRAP